MQHRFFIGFLFSILIFGGITVFADTDGTYVYSVSNNTAAITGVADKTAFTDAQIIPETIGGYPVKSISASAFKDCTGLTSITVPDSVTSIEEGAFSGCGSLQEITLPYVSGKGFGYIFGKNSYTGGSETYQKYSSNSSAYYYIPTSLEKVAVTKASSIPYGTFYNCSKIKEIILNDKITSIGDYAFYNCGWYNNLTDEFTIVGDGVLIKYNLENTNVIIPENVKHIAPRFFYNKTSLVEVVNKIGPVDK